MIRQSRTVDMYKNLWILVYTVPLLLFCASLAIGTEIPTALFQLANLGLFCFLCAASGRLMLVVRFALIFPFAKLYVVSQFAKIFFLQAADTGLTEPVTTNFIVFVGLISSIVFVYAVGVVETLFRPPVRAPDLPSRREIFYVGVVAFFIGLGFAVLQRITQGQLSVVTAYGARLVYFTLVAFSVSTYLASGGKRLFGPAALVALAIILVLSIGSGVRSDVIYPIMIFAGIYIYFKQKPARSVVLAVVLGLFFVAQILHPAVNYARMVNPTAPSEVALETLGRMVFDGDFRERVERDSNILESAWTTRLYYLRPAGLLNRFTPNQIDDVARAVEQDRIGSLSEYLKNSFQALLPQTFFGNRSETGTISMVVTVVNGYYSEGFNRPNIGVIASLFAFCGPIVAGLLYIFSLFLVYGVSRVVVNVMKYEFWTLAFVPIYAQSLADAEFGSFMITLIHGTVIQGGLLWFVIGLARALTGRVQHRRSVGRSVTDGFSGRSGSRLSFSTRGRRSADN